MGDWLLLSYLACIALGSIVVLGLGVGASNLDAHLDTDFDGEISHGHGTLSLLGWGRTPLLLSLSVALLLFGATGTVSEWFKLPGVFSVPLSLVVAYVLGGVVTRLVSHCIPSFETRSTTDLHLVGRRATVILPSGDGKPGLIQMKYQNDLLQFAYTSNEKFRRDDIVLIVNIDRKTRIANVCDDPSSWSR